MPTPSHCRRAVLAAALVAACLPGYAREQAPRSNPSQQPAAAPQSSSSSSTTAAEVDRLLADANDEINVRGQFQRAAELAAQALTLSREAGDKFRTSRSMVFLSAAYGYQGRLTDALEVSQANLALAREIGDDKILEEALNTVASVLGELGRYEESLGHFYECLDVARRIGDPVMHYMSLLNIGEAYVRSGEPDRAEAPLQESLRLAQGLPSSSTANDRSKKGREMALLNLGAMEAERNNHELALKYYEQVHISHPASPLWVITALAGMADAYEQLGQPQRAIALLREALPLSEKAATGLQYARLTSHLGVNQEALGQLEDSLASQTGALEIVRQSGGNPDYEWQIESRLGHVLRALGREEDAVGSYRRSIDGIERLRAVAVNTDEGRAGVLAKSRQVYAEAADLLYELHRHDEALALAERGRARAFLEVLAESRVGVTDALTPDQRSREESILARISISQKTEWEPNIAAAAKKRAEAELASAEEDLQRLHVEVRQSNPRYASVRYPAPVRLDQIQSALVDDDRAAFVEYLLGDRRSLVWVVTKNGFEAAALPSRRDIEQQVVAYRKALATPVSVLTLDASLTDITRLGTQLYRSLIRPVEQAIGPRRRLIIVPDGALVYLPFEAIVTGTTRTATDRVRPSFLIERTAVAYGPSASALLAVAALNRVTAAPERMLLAFGDPDTGARSSLEGGYQERGFSLTRLPYARAEVLAIGKLFPAGQRDLRLGADAREETVKTQALEGYRFIHFATHGFLDESKPDRSGILLSRNTDSREDGILQLGEIMRLKMRADLVTLSACSTGLGKLVSGEGILGLTRAIFYAGARSVAVTLWNVNDSATAALMESFYRNLRAGLTKDEAMRRAKLGLLEGRQESWRHPYFWAPFVIEGKGD